MKKNILTATCTILLLMAALSSNAQQAKAPVAKIESENSQKTATQSTVTEVREPAKPAALPFKKSDVPQQAVAPEKPKQEEKLKAIEINTATQKGMSIKNADRPKSNTLETSKKAEPVAAPAPVVVSPKG